MASAPMVQRDERTIAVENASYRSAYLFLSYGILALVAYRSFVLHESGWDLLALVILGGVVTTAYQGIHGVLNRQWAATCLLTAITAGALAAVIGWLR